MTVCERIDTILKSRNMSRRKLAILAGISPSSLQSAMARNTTLSLDMLFPISDVLDVSPEYLDTGVEKPRIDTELVTTAVDVATKDKYPEIDIPPDLTPDEAQQLLDEIAQIADEARSAISTAMKQLRQSMAGLNDIGKQKVIKHADDYAQDLAKIPEYQASHPSSAPSEGTDTTPPLDSPEGK